MKIKSKNELKRVVDDAISKHGPNVDLNHLDVSAVKSMVGLFANTKFNGAIDRWDVSNVEDMSDLFLETPAFNQPIGKWNVGKVRNMEGMFCSASRFNQPLNFWNVSNVESMEDMFFGAEKFNQQLNLWDVRKVKLMSNMLQSAHAFNCISSVLAWDPKSLEDGGFKFYDDVDFVKVRTTAEKALLSQRMPVNNEMHPTKKKWAL